MGIPITGIGYVGIALKSAAALQSEKLQTLMYQQERGGQQKQKKTVDTGVEIL
jgi:hypothetical protein